MPASHSVPFSVSGYFRLARTRWELWVLPTACAAVLSLAYVLFGASTWEASQALVVRDEVAAGGGKPGKFSRFEDMKTLQETLLEVAKSRATLREALISVGPPSSGSSAAWPTEKAIDALQDSIKLVPPKGAEFGKTEVFYLKVQDTNRLRAMELASAMCRELIGRFEKLRGRKAQGVINELERTVALAQEGLRTATNNLSAEEREAGRDLADLRMINESPSGDCELRKTIVELQAELRTQKANVQLTEELARILEESTHNPGHLLAAPSRLFESQPALKKLKDGLLDAQLKSSQLAGSLTELHPLMQGAKAAEAEISEELEAEIRLAQLAVEVDLGLAEQRVATLSAQQADVLARFEKIAGMRAEYGNLVTQVKNRSDIAKAADLELSDAQATLSAAQNSSLITTIDVPDTGRRPLGLGRTMTVLAATAGGFFAGLGIIFLLMPASSTPARELAQHIPYAAPLAKAKPITNREVEEEAAIIASLASMNYPSAANVPGGAPLDWPATIADVYSGPGEGPLNVKQALQKLASQQK